MNEQENISASNEQTQPLGDQEIFRNICLSPRKVFKCINDTHYEKHLVLLLILGGISRSFDRAHMKSLGDDMSLLFLILNCVILGGLLGWLYYYLYAALVSWTGKWIGGQAGFRQVLRIIVYSLIPSILALILLIPQISIYGIDVFRDEGDTTSAGLLLNIIFYGSLALEMALGLWTISLCVIGISEIQKFTIVKSILNLITPILIILIPIGLIILLTNGS